MVGIQLLESIRERAPVFDRWSKESSFDLGDLVSRYTWVTKDGGKPQLRLAKLNAVEPAQRLEALEHDNKPVWFITTTFEEDRDGDIVVSQGVRTDNFRKNPNIYFGHQELVIPIAKGVDDQGQLLWITEENRCKGAALFDVHDPDAMFIRGKVLRGFLNACSIAFVPVKAFKRGGSEYHKAEPRHEGDKPLGWVFEEVDLTEWSIVGVPANAGAIRDSLDREKGFISPQCAKVYGRYAAKSVNERGGCWTGWTCDPVTKVCKPCQGSQPMASEKAGKEITDWKKGERFEIFGEVFEVVRVNKKDRSLDAQTVHRDQVRDQDFLMGGKTFHIRDLGLARPFDKDKWERMYGKLARAMVSKDTIDHTKPVSSKADWLRRVDDLLRGMGKKPVASHPAAVVEHVYAENGTNPHIAAFALVQYDKGSWRLENGQAVPQGRPGKKSVDKDVRVIPWKGKFTVADLSGNRPLFGDDVMFDTERQAREWARTQKLGDVKGKSVRKDQRLEWPYFATSPGDRQMLQERAPEELAAWRQVQNQHYQPLSGSWTINDRLRNRGKLEAAFDALKRAWDRVRREDKSMKKDCGGCSQVRPCDKCKGRVRKSAADDAVYLYRNAATLDQGEFDRRLASVRSGLNGKLANEAWAQMGFRGAANAAKVIYMITERRGSYQRVETATTRNPLKRSLEEYRCKDALQDCVSRKIPIFMREHPDWSEKRCIAAAYGYCSENKALTTTSGSTGGYTVGPTKNEVMACYTRALAAGDDPYTACGRVERRLGVSLHVRKDGTLAGFTRKVVQALRKGTERRVVKGHQVSPNGKYAVCTGDEIGETGADRSKWFLVEHPSGDYVDGSYSSAQEAIADARAMGVWKSARRVVRKSEDPEEEAVEHGTDVATAEEAIEENPEDFAGEETPEEEAQEEADIEAVKSAPHHAVTLAATHQHLADLKDFLEDRKAEAEPERAAHIDDMVKDLDGMMDNHTGTFAKLYPEHDMDTVKAMTAGPAPNQGQPEGLEGEDGYTEMDEGDDVEMSDPDDVEMGEDEYVSMEEDEDEEKGEPDAKEILERYQQYPKSARRQVAKNATCMSETHEFLRSLADSEGDPVKRAALNHHAEKVKDEMSAPGVMMEEGDELTKAVEEEGEEFLDAGEGDGLEEVNAGEGSGLEELDEDERHPAKRNSTSKNGSRTKALANGVKHLSTDASLLANGLLEMKRKLGI